MVHTAEPLKINPAYDLCPDSQMLLRHFDQKKTDVIMAVGDNDEQTAQTLTENAYLYILGIDLRPHCRSPVTYARLQGDFCRLAQWLAIGQCDCIYSLSAIEHFGLGTYPNSVIDPDYDIKAMDYIWSMLKVRGTCYLTVPYGKEYIVHSNDWRVYDKLSLQERLIQNFTVEQKIFFKSAHAMCPDDGGAIPLVEEHAANLYDGSPPHLTIFLKLCKVV